MIQNKKSVQLSHSVVHYYCVGEGDGIVFLHGTNSDGESSFGHIVSEFAKDNTVIIPDYAGCGNSTLPQGEITVDQLAEQIAAIIKDSVKSPVALVGTSLGAVVAAVVAANYPELISKLVLTAPWASSQDARHQLMFQTWLALEQNAPDSATAFGLSHVLSPAFLTSLGSEKIKQICSKASAKDTDKRIQLGLNIDINESLSMIKQPTLVIGLEFDTLIPIYQVEKVHQKITQSQYSEIASGHAVQMENPQDWINCIKNFLQRK
ncbi:alpha/beta fold hydrolase [Xenorhabdus bovienii]|uniref:alpha/beta fold hydrolase n=1 Tax=Xenorhabdus bovienii TaxID=40576 RepID=UPI0023B23C8D|nr:alpha/beta hydrolase [Xenorhabdus bovienii]MDE9544626.1 alpha/beta hydrolase [Xenorhabdus bovienii]